MTRRRVTPPERLNADHRVDGFDNGRHASLDHWFAEWAFASAGASARTHVVCDARQPGRVVGHYTITTAMEERAAMPTARLRRGMPDKVPLFLIARFAVDRSFQGIGLGADLLADALRRCTAASEIVGVRAVIVHAIDDEAVGFHERHGFIASPLGEHVLLTRIEAVRG